MPNETWSKWLPHGLIIFTKLLEDWPKIVDFLLAANFWMWALFSPTSQYKRFECIYLTLNSSKLKVSSDFIYIWTSSIFYIDISHIINTPHRSSSGILFIHSAKNSTIPPRTPPHNYSKDSTEVQMLTFVCLCMK